MGGRGILNTLNTREEVFSIVNEAVNNGASENRACQYLGISKRTYLRWKQNPETGDKRNGPNMVKNKLTDQEREQVLKTCQSSEYCDLSPVQIVPALADKGKYIASESTFYRILRKNKLLTHRRRSKAPIKRKKPEAIAYAPNEVWSWDITYLPGPIKGSFYYLYMIMDIFSRKIVGWAVYDRESSDLASVLFKNTIQLEGIDPTGLIFHSDNGSPMKGSTMLSTLQRLGVIPSFSRPSVSDDNPYSESLFKTLKYSPYYPSDRFKDITQCSKWVETFTFWYNHTHLHSGVKYVTPLSRHTGKDKIILLKRKEVYLIAKKKNPERWSQSIKDWSYISEVRLNKIRKVN